MPLRIGVHPHVARATRTARTAVEDTATLLSLHGHRVLDLTEGASPLRRLLGRTRPTDHLQVLIHTGPIDPGFPCAATVPVDGDSGETVHIRLSGRAGMAGEIRELVRLVLLERPAPAAGATA